ncbi:MAG: chromosome segregation protein SMC, partial [Candidatus Poribacteria bacterium]
MNFRRMEIMGFKSFADRAELEFEPGITAVVGPNGCGKSNIADAIKWALGEQNVKALRCEKMEDLIFNGGSSRRPLGMSQVSLVILNTDKKIDSEYTEIEIERRFFKSGESEYYINRNRCLLKDIHELFMDTGLGVNAYSIMEQGHIDLILNSSPQDRRLILEEAAGITKYRHRKKTALKKLENTEQNILRINDILYELEQQVASLKRQESRARTYQRYYSELKSLDTILSKRRYKSLSAELKEIDNKIADLVDKSSLLSSNASKLEAELEKTRLEISELDVRISDIRIQERKIQSRIEEIESSLAVLKERRINLQQQKKRTLSEIERLTERIQNQERQYNKLIAEKDELAKTIQKQDDELKVAQSSADKLSKETQDSENKIESLKAQVIDALNRKARIQNELTAIESRLDYLSNRRERLTISFENFKTEKSQLQETIEKLGNEIEEKEDKINLLSLKEEQLVLQMEKLRKDLSEIEKNVKELEQRRSARSSRLQSLNELQKAYEGYGAGAKAILKSQNKEAICAVAEIIRTSAQYEIAIEACLGANVQAIITETSEDAENCLKYLIEHKSGRAIFLPISALKINITEDMTDEGVIARASQVVIFDPKYSVVVDFLLSNSFIVKDIDTAIVLAKRSDNNAQFITLDGQIVLSNGVIIGGTGTENIGLLRRSREIADLKKEVVEIDEKLNNLYKERDIIISDISSLQKEKDNITKELQSERITHNGLQKDLSQYKQRLARLEKEISVLEAEYSTIDKDISQLQENKAKLSVNIMDIEGQSEVIKSEIDKLQFETRQKAQERDAILKVCTDLRIQLASKRQQEKSLLDNITSMEKEKAQLLKALSNYQNSIASDETLEVEINEKVNTNEKVLEELFEERTKIELEVSMLESNRQNAYNSLTQSENIIRDNRRELDQIKQDRYNLEVSKTQMQMNIDSLIGKMRERYRISLEELEDQPIIEIDGQSTDESELTEEEIEKRIAEVRLRMERLGPVNLTALDEYNRQKDRYDIMVAQRDDLIKAKESLYSIIQRINAESRERMKSTFESVN